METIKIHGDSWVKDKIEFVSSVVEKKKLFGKNTYEFTITSGNESVTYFYDNISDAIFDREFVVSCVEE